MAALPDTARAALLELARQSIHAWIRGGTRPVPDVRGAEAPAGAFVSLYHGAELRGCLGHLEADRPLGQVVADMAVAAASEDPRFPPLSADEMQDLTIEISVLTEPRPARADEVEVGRDGVIVRRGARQGVLLPQVAAEYEWDRDTLLTMACRKAGLPDLAWRDGKAELLVFQAEVIAATSA